ncbi:MAG: S8 family serine peptidase [Geminicoccaceae bacterium]
MTYSVAILDEGITDGAQSRLGKATVFEHDYLFGDGDTDNHAADTHANSVFASLLRVSRAVDVLDLKIGDELGPLPYLVEQGMQDLLSLAPVHHVAAVSLSFSTYSNPGYEDEIAALQRSGVIFVVSSSNSGSHDGLESPAFPANLPGVIAVGSHDGRGRPSGFSNNGPGTDLLADGEDMPQAGFRGTSFAAPQVAATVAHVQAIVHGLTGTILDSAQMLDALRRGGTGPRSQPDPADDHTRYFLHDHARSLDYAWARYGGTDAKALEYVASYDDLSAAFGVDVAAGRNHFLRSGSVEERTIGFDGLSYVASYADLIVALGPNALAGAAHYIAAGRHEGRTDSFEELDYIASYDDLIGALGANPQAASTHFIAHGHGEGRTTSFDGLQYIASHGDLILAFGAAEERGAQHFITQGRGEGRARDDFDAAQYLANYADLRLAFGGDEEAAARHFILSGFAEGRTDGVLAGADFLI